jgi:aquaporin Z
MTTFIRLIIMAPTDTRVPAGFAPIPIGLDLLLIHLIGILVTNRAANPARSAGQPFSPGTGRLCSSVFRGWPRPRRRRCVGAAVYRWVASGGFADQRFYIVG